MATRDLRPGVAVLDCACGPGHLAVGLAQAGFAVTATDASPAMTARTAALATDHSVEVVTATETWEALSRRGWQDRFVAVFCVGNSLAHAAGRDARRQALANMSAVLAGGGRLVVTSRNWELVRGARSRIVVADTVIKRSGRRGVPIHHWVLGERWEDPHGLYVAVALLHHDDRVETVAEHLTFWPFRHVVAHLHLSELVVLRAQAPGAGVIEVAPLAHRPLTATLWW